MVMNKDVGLGDIHEILERARELGLDHKKLKDTVSRLRTVEMLFCRITELIKLVEASHDVSEAIGKDRFPMLEAALCDALNSGNMHWDQLLEILCDLIESRTGQKKTA